MEVPFLLDHKCCITGPHLSKGPDKKMQKNLYLWDLSLGPNIDSVSVHKEYKKCFSYQNTVVETPCIICFFLTKFPKIFCFWPFWQMEPFIILVRMLLLEYQNYRKVHLSPNLVFYVVFLTLLLTDFFPRPQPCPPPHLLTRQMH